MLRPRRRSMASPYSSSLRISSSISPNRNSSFPSSVFTRSKSEPYPASLSPRLLWFLSISETAASYSFWNSCKAAIRSFSAVSSCFLFQSDSSFAISSKSFCLPAFSAFSSSLYFSAMLSSYCFRSASACSDAAWFWISASLPLSAFASFSSTSPTFCAVRRAKGTMPSTPSAADTAPIAISSAASATIPAAFSMPYATPSETGSPISRAVSFDGELTSIALLVCEIAQFMAFVMVCPIKPLFSLKPAAMPSARALPSVCVRL